MIPHKYLVKSPLYIFLTGLFLLPLIYSIYPRVDYEVVKVAFFQRWVEAFCLSIVLFSFEKISVKSFLTKVNVLLLCFYFIAFLTSYLGEDYSKSFWGNSYRGDGLFTLFHGVLLFIFLQLVWNASWRKHTVHAIVLTSIFVALYALGHGISGYLNGTLKYSPWNGFYGTLGHPAFLGGYLLLTLPFFLAAQYTAPGFVTALAIISSLSRFAIGGIFLIALLKVLFGKFRITRKVLIIAYLVLSILYFAYYGIRASIVSESYKAGNNVVYEDRMRIYTKGFLGFLERPIFGYGYANFDKAFEKVDWPTKVPNDIYVDKAHSLWLEILSTTGIVGLVLHFTFLVLLFNRLNWSNPFNKAITISFLLYLLNAQVNVTSIAQDAMFWIFAGILTSEK